MAKNLALKLLFLVGLINAINGDSSARLVCYYDTRSSLKEGKINWISTIFQVLKKADDSKMNVVQRWCPRSRKIYFSSN
jgi:hypothetical protein